MVRRFAMLRQPFGDGRSGRQLRRARLESRYRCIQRFGEQRAELAFLRFMECEPVIKRIMPVTPHRFRRTTIVGTA